MNEPIEQPEEIITTPSYRFCRLKRVHHDIYMMKIALSDMKKQTKKCFPELSDSFTKLYTDIMELKDRITVIEGEMGFDTGESEVANDQNR